MFYGKEWKPQQDRSKTKAGIMKRNSSKEMTFLLRPEGKAKKKGPAKRQVVSEEDGPMGDNETVESGL